MKIKSLFLIYEVESILVPEDNLKPNLDKPYMNKYQKHVTCSMVIFMCVDLNFSKPFKSYLGNYAVYNFVNSMVEENQYCGDVMKKHFNKELVMTKQDK